MAALQILNTFLWLFGLFCVISNTAAQSQRSSRITSSRTSFGTNVKSSSSSSVSSSAAGVNFDCPEEFGYYPHPTDCTQYYVCVFGGALLESCTGGLMYSHELQTCDWPRNVGCEVVDTNERRPQTQQQQQNSQVNQHVPSRVRFGSAFTSPQEIRTQPPQQILKPTVPPQYHRQPPQVIQAQVQTIPPPPELKVSPNPIVTSRGQPKHLLEAQEEIAKLYADAHETLPPVEEEESDRQQRVYRGQPSTVSQVQKDRDGIIHQASINAIPNNDKFSSYNFGTQYRTDMLLDLDLLNNGLENVFVIDSKDLDLNVHKRVKRDLGLADASKTDEAETNEEKENAEAEEQQQQQQQQQKQQPNQNVSTKTDNLKVVKYSSRFSSNANASLLEIENLVKELYGPEVKATTTDDLMTLMQTKVNQELKVLKRILEQQKDKSERGNQSTRVPKAVENIEGGKKVAENDNATSIPETFKKLMNQEVVADTLNEAVKNSEQLSNKSENLKIDKVLKISNDQETHTEIINFSREPEDLEYVDNGDNAAAESTRTVRQLRPYTGSQTRSHWLGGTAGSNYRSIDANPFQQPQTTFSFAAFNPYLSPPSTPSYAALNSVNSQYKPNSYQQMFSQVATYKQKPKVMYPSFNLSLPPPKTTPSEDEFRPVVGKHYSPTSTSTTTSPTYLKNTDLLPYILKSLQELREQRKKAQVETFSYFNLDNQSDSFRPLNDYKYTTQKVTPHAHFSQISTVGGFYNNKNLQQQPNKNYQNNNPYISNIVPATTESNYFEYNLVGNQKMKNYYSTFTPQTSSLYHTTAAPLNLNFNVANSPKLVLQQEKYANFEKVPNGNSYGNTSTTLAESYQAYGRPVSTTIHARPLAETPPSSKPLKLQFNLPDFLSNLQTRDMAHLNPTVVDMLKYFKAVNKPLDSSKESILPAKIKPSQPYLNINEVQLKPTSTSKRPIKGYESFLNSLQKPATTKTSTSKPFLATLNQEEYYDEYDEGEPSAGVDANEDVKPPQEMPPYVPMTETMAPPRSQMMPGSKPTKNPNKNQQIYNTGFIQATTTRRPLFTTNFELYRPLISNTQANPNQIPSFINFPSDYFQEIKQKLPTKEQITEIPPLSVKPTIPTTTRQTTTSTTTRTTPTTSTSSTTTTITTTTTTTTTTRPMITTTTRPRMRYTLRPYRFRGPNKWQSSANSITNNNNTNSNYKNNTAFKTLTLDLKQKPLGIRKRPTTLASSSMGSNTGTGSNMNANEQYHATNGNSNSNRNRGNSAYQGDRDAAAPVPNNRGTHPPRTRPTLKPSGTIVSKAQEFVDIYRNLPSRPDPIYPQPQPDKTAAKCRKDVCLLPDCYCGGRDIPGDLPVEQIPQIVLVTFDDSVNDLNKQLYIDLFEKGRVNPNGCPITATFYVSHEWTDYSQVQNLYSDGHEMASHTVSHSFGEQFSQKKWTREVAGQREILAAYGGVKLSDVRGMRAPFLSVGGNKMYKMLYDSNFTYDSSMPVYENRPPSWPYTLDYKIFHDCMIPPCPTKSYPGVWQVPMVMWQDLNGGRCSMGDACSNPSDSEGVTKMIMKNFERHYTTNRAPFGLFYHAAWFTQPHHKEGFIKFLDAINAMPDVWIVTNWQALQWVRDPTPISRMNSFQPFQCDYTDRPKRCNNPKVCNLWHKSGVRYMKTCQPCPDIYPWTGKTGIRSSRIDNDIEDST